MPALLVALAISGLGTTADAAREAVLKQVDVPHSYYWRELYLPQLTTGPSSAAFSPDGQELVYSMVGSLWRQRIGSPEAVELTHASGAYDYQPDWSRDGRHVVFARYQGTGVELWRLDVSTGREQALTNQGAVNVEPRLSPDGKRLAWVSTQGTGRFNVFVADLDEKGLRNARPLLPERKSTLTRYYYSAFDHSINPSWSPDGQRVLFVGNSEVAWGSGDIWSVSVPNPADGRLIRSEETTWSARPELAPDGKRLMYSSYHVRQWHQLWLTTLEGRSPLPLTFGEFDRRNARWSPDGERIAYVSNEHGNTALYVQTVIGGARERVEPTQRRQRSAHGTLTLDVLDGKGQRVPARVSVRGSDGRAHAPADAWMQGDDGFDRSVQPTETHYFHCASPCTLSLPAGEASITVQHGFRHLPWQKSLEVKPDAKVSLRAALVANDLPAEWGTWRSADLHVHMNYGGHYRNTPANLAKQARAEDLNLVHNLIVNKEERIPDITHFRTDADPASDGNVLILHGQEHHTSYWGHLGLLHLGDHYITPDFAAYQHTALASPYPHNGVIADLAHAQGGLVGYVHPFDWDIVPEKEKSLTNQLPADVAHGKVDYLEVVGFSDHKATAQVWYRLLNLGYRLPVGAGTDAMANYASLRGPVGLNRVFLRTDGKLKPETARAALKAGRSFISNGPLLGFALGGKQAGDTVKLTAPGRVPYRLSLRSPVPVDHLELVHNGRVVKSFELKGERRTLDTAGELTLDAGGWMLLRAWNDGAHPLVLDLYPYATTSPVYVELPGGRPQATEEAAYFVRWLERVLADAEARKDYNTAREKEATLAYLREAMAKFQSRVAGR